jgi:hypothetical protein
MGSVAFGLRISKKAVNIELRYQKLKLKKFPQKSM